MAVVIPLLFKGDIGVKIVLDALVDISDATVRKIKYKKPDGTTGSWDAALESAMKLSFVTIAGSLNQSGVWWLQIYFETASGQKISGEWVEVTVLDRIVD